MKIYKVSDVKEMVDNKINPSPDVSLVCPFCKDDGFDAVGLKSHLLKGDCKVFNNIENIKRVEF